MEYSEITALLGRSAHDPDIESILDRHHIYGRPQVELDSEDADGPVVETKDWVINSHEGVEFGFEDERAFRTLEPSNWGKGPMILTQIYLYGDHPNVRPYSRLLPFGLQLADDRNTVRAKLASLEVTRRSHLRDAWELDICRMIVSYIDDGAHIGFILFMLPPPSLPIPDIAPPPLPSIETVVTLLGKNIYDAVFRATFAPFGFERCLEEVKRNRVAKFRSTYGFELGFREPGSGAPTDLVFSHIVFYRERELNAAGWRGALPLAIDFDDSPETVRRKMGYAPDEQGEDQFTGYALWHLRGCSVYVYHSSMENVVLRVRLMAPGVWESYGAD